MTATISGQFKIFGLSAQGISRRNILTGIYWNLASGPLGGIQATGNDANDLERIHLLLADRHKATSKH